MGLLIRLSLAGDTHRVVGMGYPSLVSKSPSKCLPPNAQARSFKHCDEMKTEHDLAGSKRQPRKRPLFLLVPFSVADITIAARCIPAVAGPVSLVHTPLCFRPSSRDRMRTGAMALPRRALRFALTARFTGRTPR